MDRQVAGRRRPHGARPRRLDHRAAGTTATTWQPVAAETQPLAPPGAVLNAFGDLGHRLDRADTAGALARCPLVAGRRVHDWLPNHVEEPLAIGGEVLRHAVLRPDDRGHIAFP